MALVVFVQVISSWALPDNVLLLTVDTLRTNFLGCYGNQQHLTPNIDQLATQGLLFENAVCETPLTSPSFAAMFSSRYPRLVGVLRNGMRINDKVPVAAEQFQQAGYYTFAVQSNWTLRGRLSGLNRGFDLYEDNLTRRRWIVFSGERYAEEVLEAAEHILRDRPRDRPFFAWIHFSDPHAPYRYHKGFGPSLVERRKRSREERVRIRYASEIAYTDYYIGKLLAYVPPNTHIVFAADHGESLYEHDYCGHGLYLYQTCMHIPLIICSPRVRVGRTSKPVQAIDIGPTLLRLADLHVPDTMLGLDLTQECLPEYRLRFMETYGGAVPQFPGAKNFLKQTSPLFQAVLAGTLKVVRPLHRPPVGYFLDKDPTEIHPVQISNKDEFLTLLAALDLWEAAYPKDYDDDGSLTKEDIEVLTALGYVSGVD